MHYHAFDLHIESEIPLPARAVSPGHADVRIRLGKVNVPLPEAGCFRATQEEFVFSLPSVGAYQLRASGEIVVEPAAGADSSSVQHFLLYPVFTALMQVRGLLTLHGCAVEYAPGKAFACVGSSAVGKSTLAMACERAGYPVVTDQLLVVDEDLRVLPGWQQIELWQDVLKKLQVDHTQLVPVRPNLSKYVWPLMQTVTQPVQLTHMFMMKSCSFGGKLPERLADKPTLFRWLKEQTQGFVYLQGLGKKPQHFMQSTQLIQNVPCYLLARSKNEPQNLVKEIETVLSSAKEADHVN